MFYGVPSNIFYRHTHTHIHTVVFGRVCRTRKATSACTPEIYIYIEIKFGPGCQKFSGQFVLYYYTKRELEGGKSTRRRRRPDDRKGSIVARRRIARPAGIRRPTPVPRGRPPFYRTPRTRSVRKKKPAPMSVSLTNRTQKYYRRNI